MSKITKYKIFAALLLPGVVAALTSCASDGPSDIPGPTDGGEALTVTATVGQARISRAKGETIYVRDGIYNLSYMLPDNENWNVASVDFNKEGANTPGIGIVTVPVDEELRWLGVGGGATPTFYLDNVDADRGTQASTKTDIMFGEGKNPYIAAVYDSISGSNDLLWGSAMAQRNNTKTINFDLNHNLAMVRVQVTVDRTNASDTEPLDVENAKVEITSVNQTPLSYNRLDGNLTLSTDESAYTTLTVVDPEDPARQWNNDTKDPENDNITTYYSVNFILPPQELLADQNRPKLVITLPNNTVYSGIIPHAMLVDDMIHDEPSYPAALSFLKGHILTLRTVITEEPPTLAFMPVTVVRWVDKGDFTIEAHQAGIYTPQEFYNLIAYYKAGNDYQLERYGWLETIKDDDGNEIDTKWKFDFFNSVTLDFDKIYNTLTPESNGMKDFYFAFNNYRIYVENTKTGVEVNVTPQQLYNIVTGRSGMPNP